jgi:hypothetical protein
MIAFWRVRLAILATVPGLASCAPPVPRTEPLPPAPCIRAVQDTLVFTGRDGGRVRLIRQRCTERGR